MGKNRLDDSLASSIEKTKNTSIPSKPRKSPERPWVRTFYLTPEIRSRLARLQQQWQLETESELVRWLLTYALDHVDEGKAKPRFESVTRLTG